MQQKRPRENRAEERRNSRPLSELFAEDLLHLLDIRQGEKVLQVGAGMSDFALAAWNEGAEVTVADFSREILEDLRLELKKEGQHTDEIRVELMNDDMLNRPNESYDKALLILPMVSFFDRARGLRELHRVVKTEGMAAVITWVSPEGTDVFPVLIGAFETTLNEDGAALQTLMPTTIADAMALARELRHAGFHKIRLERAEHVWKAESSHELWSLLRGTAGDIASLGTRLGPEKVRTLREKFLSMLEEIYGHGPVELPAEALIGVGTK